jgi:hypothetical protein
MGGRAEVRFRVGLSPLSQLDLRGFGPFKILVGSALEPSQYTCMRIGAGVRQEERGGRGRERAMSLICHMAHKCPSNHTRSKKTRAPPCLNLHALGEQWIGEVSNVDVVQTPQEDSHDGHQLVFKAHIRGWEADVRQTRCQFLLEKSDHNLSRALLRPALISKISTRNRSRSSTLTFKRPNTPCCMFCLRILARMTNRLSQTTIMFSLWKNSRPSTRSMGR